MTADPIERLTFWVEGVPVPQGSKSIFRGRPVDANPGLKGWRKTVTAAAVKALAGRDGFTEAVYVLIDFYLPRGRTVKRRRPSVRPDVDKLIRAIFDSLTDALVWADDGLVVTVHALKHYADSRPAGARISIQEAA